MVKYVPQIEEPFNDYVMVNNNQQPHQNKRKPYVSGIDEVHTLTELHLLFIKVVLTQKA